MNEYDIGHQIGEDGMGGLEGSSACLHGVRREHAAAHQEQAADRRDARDGVRHRHERRVQRRRHAPHRVVADDARHAEPTITRTHVLA